jgi:hypothetical protein
MSTRMIAERLSLHRTTVGDALDKEFERVRPSEAEVEVAREKKRERLYRGLEKWVRVRDDSIAACEANPDRLPDYKAGELVIRTEALLANVEGTDAPKHTELTGKNGEPLIPLDMSKLTDEQIERLAAGDSEAVAVGDPEGDPGSCEAGAGEA